MLPQTRKLLETLPIHLFKESFGEILELLNEHDVKYEMREVRMNVPIASGGTLEIIQVVGNVAMWGSLATVIVAYIKSRRGQKVIITTREGTIVHAEGLSYSELNDLLEKASNLTVFDPTKSANETPGK